MKSAVFQFVPQRFDFLLDAAARQRQAQIAQARIEQALVGPARPRTSRRAPGAGLAPRLAGFGFARGDVRLLIYVISD